MAERSTRIDDMQAQYHTDAQQADREMAVRNALSHVDPHSDDAQQPYAEIVWRLHAALQRVMDTNVSPSA